MLRGWSRRSSSEAMAVLGIFFVSAMSVQSQDFWSSQYKMTITFSGYDKSETLTNFPALVVFNTNITNFAYCQFASSNGWDLRFANAARKTNLNYEIASWATNGDSYVWVQVPALSGTNDFVWAYWGNDLLTNAPAVYTTNGATWSQDYVGVWHLDATNEAGRYLDSATNGNSFITNGAPRGTNAVVSGGVALRDGEYLRSSQSIPLTGAVSRTVGLWVRIDPSSDMRGYLFSMGDKSRYYGVFSVCLNASHMLRYWLHWNNIDTDDTLIAGTWQYYVFKFNGSALEQYIDGVKVDTTFTNLVNTSPDQPANLGFSGWEDNEGSIPFAADEFRISSVARSTNWIWAEWMNMASNSTFCTYAVRRTPGLVIKIR